MRTTRAIALFLGIIFLTVCVETPVRAFVIEPLPILYIESKTDELPPTHSVYTTTIIGVFRIGQVRWEGQQFVWLWYEDHGNIVVPSGVIEEFQIRLQHNIVRGYDLVFRFMGDLYDDGNDICNTYGFKEGVTPPVNEPASAPLIPLPLADPRPTPINFNIYTYVSPPTLVALGRVFWSPLPVGGEIIHTDLLGLMAPWIVAVLAALAIGIGITSKKRILH